MVFAATVPAINPFAYSDNEEGRVFAAAKVYTVAEGALSCIDTGTSASKDVSVLPVLQAGNAEYVSPLIIIAEEPSGFTTYIDLVVPSADAGTCALITLLDTNVTVVAGVLSIRT